MIAPVVANLDHHLKNRLARARASRPWWFNFRAVNVKFFSGTSSANAGAVDAALGFVAAAREVWPETRTQGCWCHQLVSVLDKLPS